MPRPSFRQSDVQRAVKAVRACGLSVAEVEVERDGRIRIKVGEPVEEKDVAADIGGYL